jgi:DNA-binding transcriptional regulator GbsR (MarR family)
MVKFGAMGDDDDDVLLQAVERFGTLLTEAGMPRMAARIFAYLIIDETDAATAGQLAARLRVSPAAVSGAVRYLVQTAMLERHRRPGARSDEYRLHGDLWYETYLQRTVLMRRWEDTLAEAIEAVGPERAGRSLRESREFLAFLREEYPAMMERWHERRASLDG